ncbi:DUF4007 family protein [bacterium AH-315-J19]|nr:DUF4007 family protein [Robiginitomaculum sp.]MBN4058500.1 DUF4007 family protein [bacterium AH-315-J19]
MQNYFNENYRPKFTGHETFHLRYGWLKKAFDAVEQSNSGEWAEKIFTAHSAIARLGVGKNMVASIRHWALSCGIIASNDDALSGYAATDLGNFIFAPQFGVDPYLEKPTSLWLLHWHLVTQSKKTTFLWVFNEYSEAQVEREQALIALETVIRRREWSGVAAETLRKDINNLIGTYSLRQISKRLSVEDSLSSPFTELGLMKQTASNAFAFSWKEKTTLSDAMFAYSLMDFWKNTSPATQTLSFEALIHEPFGPGRIFRMTVDELSERVSKLSDTTNGKIRLSNTAGMNQILRSTTKFDEDPIDRLKADYMASTKNKAA